MKLIRTNRAEIELEVLGEALPPQLPQPEMLCCGHRFELTRFDWTRRRGFYHKQPENQYERGVNVWHVVQVAPNRYPQHNWNRSFLRKAKPFEWERIGQNKFLRHRAIRQSTPWLSSDTGTASRGGAVRAPVDV